MASRLSRRHTPLQTALAALTVLLAATSAGATASSSSSKRALCLASRSAELADLAACGHEGSINYCLSHPAQRRPAAGLGQALGYGALVETADIERCFVNAGCTAREAAVEAEWALRRCDELGDSPSMADLRRRHLHQDQNQNQNQHPAREAADAAATPAPRAADVAPARILDARQPQGGTTAPPAATATPEPTTTTTATTQTGCHTTRTTSTTTCPVQTTGPESGRRLPCFPTSITFLACMDGYRCGSDSEGVSTCLKLDNHVPTAGVIIGLLFAAAVVAAAATICFCCCRERREHRRIRRAAEAAALARGAAARAAGDGDRKPLVPQGQQQHDPFADSQAYQPYQQQRRQ
ncbi:hypothetical protein RB595_007900 [Gaeumannomyces hyphopodioides]